MRWRICLFASWLLIGCSVASHPALTDPKTIDGVPIQRWLGARSAMLFSKPVTNASTQPSQFALTMQLGTAYALAAAVDRRGYFLTASHCTHWDSMTIVYRSQGRFTIEEPKVMWKDDKADIALLRVAHTLDVLLNLCTDDDIHPKSPIWAAGFDPATGQLTGVSGELIGVDHFSDSAKPSRYVLTNSPSNPGDSGGAVVDVSGNLIGVIVRGDVAQHRC